MKSIEISLLIDFFLVFTIESESFNALILNYTLKATIHILYIYINGSGVVGKVKSMMFDGRKEFKVFINAVKYIANRWLL